MPLNPRPNAHPMLYFSCCMDFVLYACCINVLYACCIFCVVFSCCMKLSFPVCFYSSVIRKFSLPVLCSCCIRVVKKKQKKHYVLYFSACGTRSGILCCIFPRVERALVFFVIYFPTFLFISCCIILTLISFIFFHSAFLKISLIYALWYCEILCYIFPCLERALVLCYIFPHVENALVLWNFLLYFSTCGTRFGIVDSCV